MLATQEAPVSAGPVAAPPTMSKVVCAVCDSSGWFRQNTPSFSRPVPFHGQQTRCYACQGAGTVDFAPPAEPLQVIQPAERYRHIVDQDDHGKLAIPEVLPEIPFTGKIMWVGPRCDIPRVVRVYSNPREHPRGFVENDEASKDDTTFIQRDELLQREIERLKAEKAQWLVEKAQLLAEKDQHLTKIEHLEHDNATLLRLGDETVAPAQAQAAVATEAKAD